MPEQTDHLTDEEQAARRAADPDLEAYVDELRAARLAIEADAAAEAADERERQRAAIGELEADGLTDEQGRRLLELNGFNAVRSEAIRLLQALAGLPLDALEATIVYNQRAGARLKAAGPTSRDALAVAERELEYLRLVTRQRRELKNLEERLAARDRITAR